MPIKKLFGRIPAVFSIVLVILFFSKPLPVNAADVRTGNNVIISQSQTNLKDLYLFGRTIDISAPVNNDVVAAGGNINISGAVSNNLMAAGGTIIINSPVGNTVRVAGGNVTIDGPIKNDLVIAGGSVIVSKHATIEGDLLAAGGQITVEGPVKGKIMMTGGDITLNSAVNGNVTVAHAGTFTLGPEAKINGSLTYTSTQPLTKDPGSVVKGPINYHHVEKQQQKEQPAAQAQAWIGFGIYQLLVEIVLSILLLYFVRKGMLTTLLRMKESPWKSLGIGFLYVVFAPLISLILLVLLPLGLASFFFYFLLLIVSIFIRDIFTGWFIMHWWENRNKKDYFLDWKAGVIGPIGIFLINLIPILGWLVSAIIGLIGIGALLINLTNFMPQLQTIPKKK